MDSLYKAGIILTLPVGRTHIIVRFQAGNRRKDHGTENFGGFVYV